MADLGKLRDRRVTAQLRRRWMNPDWSLLDRSALIGRRAHDYGICAWSAPGAGPATPRQGSVGDVLNAIYRVPCVRRYVDTELARLERFGLSIWDNASTGGKVGIASGGVVVVGGGVAGLIALGPLSGVDLPVPGVPGLSARVALGEDALPSGYGDIPSKGAWGFGLTLDLAKIFPDLQ